jgi:long-chain acyl-CoA synthetase
MAIGIPDEYHGEKIKAFVVLAEGQSATEEELIDHCKANLALYKVPRSIAFRSVLPRTEVGKALRRILREEEIAAMQENK